MNLEMGKQCKWNEIEVGEVYCFSNGADLFIDEKLGVKPDRSFCLADTSTESDFTGEETSALSGFFYKLPLKTQRLWKEI